MIAAAARHAELSAYDWWLLIAGMAGAFLIAGLIARFVKPPPLPAPGPDDKPTGHDPLPSRKLGSW